jgi:protein SCO1/2
MSRRSWVAALVAVAMAAPAPAQFMTGRGPAAARPEGVDPLTAQRIVSEAGFDQRLGERLPLEAAFRDETGREVALGDYFGDKPVLLALVYYHCPMLCTMVMNAVASSFKGIPFEPGREFEVVFVSFDPTDTAALAAEKKTAAVARYGKLETAAGWHFLTGDAAAISALTAAVGFRYVKDETSGEFAHAAGVMVATPDGRLARYLFGIDYAPKDLKLALVEASEGRIGGVVDQLLLLCYHYDTTLGRYTAVSMLWLRITAAATLAAVVSFIALMLLRERRARRRLAAGGVASV